MNLLPLWNNGYVLVFLLMTGVLALACLASLLLRRSAALKNSILLPTLVIIFVIPPALLAARGTGWSIPVPVLRAGSDDPALPVDQPGSGVQLQSPTPAAPIGTPSTDAAETERAASAGEGSAPVDVRSVVRWVWSVGTWLMVIWGIGSAICLLRLGRSYLSLRRLLASARPLQSPRVAAAAEEAASELGLERDPTIAVSYRLSSPMAFGTPKRGWVICPPDSIERMPHDQLVHVLMHECAHIAHRDSSLRLVQGLGAALWWWHPLVHLLNRQLSWTREELCDNVVLSSADPVQYGRTLLEVVRCPTAHEPPALAVALFPEHVRLEKRIRSLLNPRRSIMNRSKPSVLISACLAGVAVSAFAGTTRVTSEAMKSPVPEEPNWIELGDRTLVREFALSMEDDTKPGHLDIDIKRGDILVTAYDGDKVLVRLSVPNQKPASNSEDNEGFRSPTARPVDFNVRQNVNFIELDGNSYEDITHVEVLVPRRIDLTLDTYRTGVIRVVGVEGHIRARSQNNDIFLMGISGSADVYGYNGNLSASFHEVTGDLEFDTYNGNVALTLPADIQATTFIRAEREEVKSQFAISERPAELIVTEHEDGRRTMDFGDYAVGEINGGGTRLVIETTNGVIKLHKP